MMDPFTRQLQLAIEQADELNRKAFEAERPVSRVLLETLHELQSSLEELQVAHEELHQQQDELFASRATAEIASMRYQALFEFAPDGYIVTDLNGIIREANRAASVLLQTEPEFLGGKVFVNYVLPTERPNFRRRLQELSTTGRASKWEFCLTPRGGDPFYVSATVEAGHDPETQVPLLRWSLRDVSDRKRLEESLRDLNTDLERRVQERTEELERANRA